MGNTLAYYNTVTITAIKSFIVQAPGVDYEKLFTALKSFIIPYFIESIVHFFIENVAEILPAHYIYKVAFTNLIHKQSIQVKL